MQFLDLAKKRYSLRKYVSTPVSREIIERCLEAARLAPSACNSQPWHFIVVDQEPLRSRLASIAFSGLYSMNKFAKAAPVQIVVVREHSKVPAAIAGQFRGLKYSLMDTAIASEHLILQAAEEGVGTCWLGWFNERGVKRLLGVPRRNRIDVIISMGYPEEENPVEKIRRNMDEIRTYWDDD